MAETLIKSAEAVGEEVATTALSLLGDIGLGIAYLANPTELNSGEDAQLAKMKGAAKEEKKVESEPEPAAGGKGVRGGKKDRSLQGTVDQLEGVQQHRDNLTKRGGYRVSPKKSEQNLRKATKSITTSKDLENQ